jgi:hypothetical protein
MLFTGETNTTNNKTDTDSESDLNNETKNIKKQLEYVVLNLKVMGDIKEFDKLTTINPNIEIDVSTTFQGFRRWFTGNGRQKTIEKLQTVGDNLILLTDRLLKEEIEDLESSVNILQDIIPDMINATRGLQNLKITYKNDVLTENQIVMLIKKINDQVDKIKKSMRIIMH